MHRLIKFKNFEDAKVDLFRPFSILIGKNGSGKSNAIEGVELLSELAHGRPLHDITDVGRGNGTFQVRGGLAACPKDGQDHFALEFSAFMDFQGKKQPVTYSVSVRTRPEPRIACESLRIGGRVLFETLEQMKTRTKGVLDVRFDNFAQGPHKPRRSLSPERSVLSQYEDLVEGRRNVLPALKVVRALRRYLHGSFVFDPQPKMMRGYERIGNRVLARDGSNLSAVLHALSTGTPDERATLKRILDRIKAIPEEPFDRFEFVSTELQDVMMVLAHGDSVRADARVLSDGTLRALAVLAALEAVPDGSRVIIEEFDNGVHPTRVGVVSQAVSETASRRRLNVLCTTHNPATLDSLTRDQLEGVVLCVFDSAAGGARLIQLHDLPRSDVLLERGSLGDLVTRRVIEEYLAPDFEEAHRARMQQWMDSLP